MKILKINTQLQYQYNLGKKHLKEKLPRLNKTVCKLTKDRAKVKQAEDKLTADNEYLYEERKVEQNKLKI